MGSSSEHAPSPAFQARFHAVAGAARCLRFDAFMQLALYDEEVGYYRRAQPRVGRGPERDFYTATSSGPLFGELVAAAATHLLGDRAPAEFTFVEVGAEPGGGVLRGLTTPFAATRELRIGDDLALTGPTVLFANELFDAQPFRRHRREAAGWTESYVTLTDGQLAEEFRPGPPPPGAPDDLPVGYHVDHAGAAIDLIRRLTAGDWPGVCLFFDYGYSREHLYHACPQGSARSYRRHRVSGDLLAHPGDQDLTCHVCWDDLGETLTAAGFDVEPPLSQEAFLVRRAGDRLAAILAREGGGFSPAKQAILQLLHPGNLGQKFQVLAAQRGLPPAPAA